MARELGRDLLEELHQAGFPEAATESILLDRGAVSGETVAGAGDLAIAVGPLALSHVLERSPARQVVAVMLTRANFDDVMAAQAPRTGREVYAVVLDQPLARYLNLVGLALPQRPRIGVLLGDVAPIQMKVLERLAVERGMSINAATIPDEASFIPQLSRLLGQCDVLLALPDPRIHNRNTVQYLLLATYRAGVPVVAYSDAYRKAGALVSLYSTPAQLARQAAGIAWDLGQRRPVARLQYPRDFTVGVNDTVARSLGLPVPAEEALRGRLKQMQD